MFADSDEDGRGLCQIAYAAEARDIEQLREIIENEQHWFTIRNQNGEIDLINLDNVLRVRINE